MMMMLTMLTAFQRLHCSFFQLSMIEVEAMAADAVVVVVVDYFHKEPLVLKLSMVEHQLDHLFEASNCPFQASQRL